MQSRSCVVRGAARAAAAPSTSADGSASGRRAAPAASGAGGGQRRGPTAHDGRRKPAPDRYFTLTRSREERCTFSELPLPFEFGDVRCLFRRGRRIASALSCGMMVFPVDVGPNAFGTVHSFLPLMIFGEFNIVSVGIFEFFQCYPAGGFRVIIVCSGSLFNARWMHFLATPFEFRRCFFQFGFLSFFCVILRNDFFFLTIHRFFPITV